MGKGGGKAPKVQQSPTDIETAAGLKSLRTGFTEPLQALVTPQVLQAFANNNPFSTTMPGSSRDLYENQFDVANRNIQNTAGGRGGMLRRSLVQNQTNRAGTIAKAQDDYKQLGVERAMGMLPTAYPNAATQMSAAQGIAGRENTINQANAEAKYKQQQSQSGGIGSAVGTGLGLLGKFFGK